MILPIALLSTTTSYISVVWIKYTISGQNKTSPNRGQDPHQHQNLHLWRCSERPTTHLLLKQEIHEERRSPLFGRAVCVDKQLDALLGDESNENQRFWSRRCLGHFRSETVFTSHQMCCQTLDNPGQIFGLAEPWVKVRLKNIRYLAGPLPQ